SQLFDRSDAKIRNQRAVAILIVRTRVVRIEPARADRIIEDVDLTVAGDRLAKGSISTAFFADGHAGLAGSLFRENLNRAGERARSVDRALRSAHDFDAIDVVRGEISKVERALQTLIDRNAVEQDLRVFAAKSTREDRR